MTTSTEASPREDDILGRHQICCKIIVLAVICIIVCVLYIFWVDYSSLTENKSEINFSNYGAFISFISWLPRFFWRQKQKMASGILEKQNFLCWVEGAKEYKKEFRSAERVLYLVLVVIFFVFVLSMTKELFAKFIPSTSDEKVKKIIIIYFDKTLVAVAISCTLYSFGTAFWISESMARRVIDIWARIDNAIEEGRRDADEAIRRLSGMDELKEGSLSKWHAAVLDKATTANSERKGYEASAAEHAIKAHLDDVARRIAERLVAARLAA